MISGENVFGYNCYLLYFSWYIPLPVLPPPILPILSANKRLRGRFSNKNCNFSILSRNYSLEVTKWTLWDKGRSSHGQPEDLYKQFYSRKWWGNLTFKKYLNIYKTSAIFATNVLVFHLSFVMFSHFSPT